MTDSKKLIPEITKDLENLTSAQVQRIGIIVKQYLENCKFNLNKESDLFTQPMVEEFGDALMEHNCASRLAFTKDKFEYQMENLFNRHGRKANLAKSRTNQGHDITIDGVRYSLKTQADASIKEHELFISKFMELGKDEWTDKIEHLENQRNHYLDHLKNYDRIIQLRNISWPGKKKTPDLFSDNNLWVYELVEIPKQLMLEAKSGKFEFSPRSKTIPRTGYCRIFDDKGEIKFALYFDGAGERKLQIKYLKKKHCTVHATWSFKLA